MFCFCFLFVVGGYHDVTRCDVCQAGLLSFGCRSPEIPHAASWKTGCSVGSTTEVLENPKVKS